MTPVQPGPLPDIDGSLTFDEPRDKAVPAFWLTLADIREFQLLMERLAGLSLDEATAWRRAIQLTGLVRALIGPIPEDPEVALDRGSTPVTIAH